jgi:hypothetical protein
VNTLVLARAGRGRQVPIDPLGYQLDHPIYEIVQDVGVVIKPESWTTRKRVRPADYYVVTFILEDRPTALIRTAAAPAPTGEPEPAL